MSRLAFLRIQRAFCAAGAIVMVFLAVVLITRGALLPGLAVVILTCLVVTAFAVTSASVRCESRHENPEGEQQ